MVISLLVDLTLGMGWKKKRDKKERRCIQINYVTFETDWKVKVKYPVKKLHLYLLVLKILYLLNKLWPLTYWCNTELY